MSKTTGSAGLNGRPQHSIHGKESPLQEWQRNTEQTINRSLDLTRRRSGSRTRTIGDTIRTVTPEVDEGTDPSIRSQTPTRPITQFDAPASPRSIPGGEKSRDRRAGLVFEDWVEATPNLSPTQSIIGSPNQNKSPIQSPNTRLRTRTLDDTQRPRQISPPISKSRHRIGSVHSTAAFTWSHKTEGSLSTTVAQHALPSSPSTKSGPIQKAASTKDKSGRKLQRKDSRPISPLVSPTSDSLLVPFQTQNATKVVELMKSLAGQMRGPLAFQAIAGAPWVSGMCYIDENRNSLMYEELDKGPFHTVIIPDLRGCRVKQAMFTRTGDAPVYHTEPEDQTKCLEINATGGMRLRLIPLETSDLDRWLAALLHWQQIRVGGSQLNLNIPGSSDQQSGALSRMTSSRSLKEASIIKVGRVLLWERGSPISPTTSVSRASSRNRAHSRGPTAGSWQKVSCTLQDNGEFRLHSEKDVALLSVIQLSQLSRHAVQQLDRSVLGEEHCIAIFPQYTSTSTAISIIRPVFIALDQRVYLEVWYVLLRAFAIPEMYGPQISESDDEASDLGYVDDFSNSNEIFRIDKSLSIRVVEAKVRKAPTSLDLFPNSKRLEYDAITGDYYAEINVDGELRARTTVKHNTKNPFWRMDCDFQDLSAPELSFILKRQLPSLETSHDRRPLSSTHETEPADDIICGTASVNLGLQHEKGMNEEAWLPVLNEHSEQIGEIFLKIRYEETVVLLARDYQHISELLHNFSNGLTVQIAQLIPGKLKFLSETFMNIFQVSGQANHWLMALVEDEIDGIGKDQASSVKHRFSKRVGSNDSSYSSVGERELSVREMNRALSGEANLLFRGNSLLTQALDFHLRRLGAGYLEEILKEKIEEINEKDPNCEVDPSRLGPGDDMARNWTQLVAFTTGVWNCIAASATRCPPPIRGLLKYIRAVADDRYGNYLQTVPYTSVSGFLFLRFICPSILNPKLFNLLLDHPKPRAQRTLTLIAKSLQVLANLSSFGQKESWMEPMNRFLSSHRQEFKTFIDNITSIPAERTVVALPASFSTPIQILGRLPPTSREGFPSLPYLIDHARNFASLVNVFLDATSDLVSMSSLTGDLLIFHDLCVTLQHKRDECVRKAELRAQDIDNMSSALQWDDLLASPEALDTKQTDFPSPLQPSPFRSSSLNSSSTVAFHTPYNTRSTMSISTVSSRPPGSSSSAENTTTGSTRTSITSGPRRSAHRTTSEFEKDKRDRGEQEKKERQSFWESTFGRDSRYQRPYGGVPDTATDGSYRSYRSGRSLSPPSRGVSRGGEKKEKRDKKEERRGEKEKGELSGDLKRDKSSACNKDKDGIIKEMKEKSKESKDKGFLGLGIGKKKDKSEKERDFEKEKKLGKISGPISTTQAARGFTEERVGRHERSKSLGTGNDTDEAGRGDGMI